MAVQICNKVGIAQTVSCLYKVDFCKDIKVKCFYSHEKTLFSISMHNTITNGKHSLPYLGPTLWSKLTTADRSVTLLASLKNRISKPDLSSLLDGGCRSCALCNSFNLKRLIVLSYLHFKQLKKTHLGKLIV